MSQPVALHVIGEVAGADAQHSTTHLDLGFGTLDSERVQLAGRVWTRDGTGPWIEEQGAGGDTGTSSLGLTLNPAALIGVDAHERLRAALSGLPSTPERLGSVDAVRFTLSGERLRNVLGVPPTGSAPSLASVSDDWTFWVTRDRWLPVRLLADVQGQQGSHVHVELDFADQNASDIRVQAPNTP